WLWYSPAETTCNHHTPTNKMKKPPASTIATVRSCRSFFFSSSKISMTIISVQFPVAPDFAVGPETAFNPLLVAERMIAPVQKSKNNRRRQRAAGGHHNPLPERTPAEQRLLAAGQQ